MYPIKIEGYQLPAPVQWDVSYATVETVNETEAGTDQVVLIRNNKISVMAGFQLSSYMMSMFKSWKNLRTVTLNMYDPDSNAMKDYTVRIREFNASLVPQSDKKAGTAGLWNVTFTIIQF